MANIESIINEANELKNQIAALTELYDEKKAVLKAYGKETDQTILETENVVCKFSHVTITRQKVNAVIKLLKILEEKGQSKKVDCYLKLDITKIRKAFGDEFLNGLVNISKKPFGRIYFDEK